VIRASAPTPNGSLRQEIYHGALFLLPANPASSALVAAVLSLLREVLGSPLREAQARFPPEDYFHCIGEARQRLASEPCWPRLVDSLLAEVGFVPEDNAGDAPRLRAIVSGGHLNPKAAPAYFAHRDTWYANPRAQINWWLPLHDVTEQETFCFYPDCFGRAVANTSAGFDYETWMAQVGWQNTAGRPAVYPSAAEPLEDQAKLGFACRAGEILLFSAAHLHQTRPNTTGLTRFSIDLRTVHLRDHAEGQGAADVDNASTGSALADYRRSPRQEGQT
jgi:Phytanoyl-CoA dioxygenase (PhyH)